MHSLYYFLKFYLTATNQHGVHSPFVYDFVTKCLYKKTNGPLSITEKVLIKSLDYFKFKNLSFGKVPRNLEQKIKTKNPELRFNKIPWEIYYTNICSNIFEIINKQDYTNDSMLLISDIHRNMENHNRWLLIKKEKRVSVTIDLFYCGIVFFRSEQEKEHFKIRI